MIVVTTDTVPEREIAATLGLVRGNTVRARNFGRRFAASMVELMGGEVEEYTKLLAESREQALDRMIAQARALGADAIVGLRFATSEISRGSAEFMAYGTAVRLVRSEPGVDPDARRGV